MEVLHSLSPVFFVIFLGALLRRTGFLSPGLIQGTNRLAYWVGLPCVLFRGIAKSHVQAADQGEAILVLLACTTLAIGAGYLAARVFQARSGSTGTVVQAAFRGNLAFVGLPVLYYSASDPSAEVAVAIVLLSVAVPVYNTAAVTVLLADRHKLGAAAFARILRQLATNPLILASLAGAGYAMAGLPLPLGIDRTFEALGQMALPLALLGIGASIRLETIRGNNFALLAAASSIKVALCPLCGYLLAEALGLPPLQTRVVCVYLACPTAAASFVLADQLGGDRPLAAGCVALSTVLSMPSLWMMLWIVQT